MRAVLLTIPLLLPAAPAAADETIVVIGESPRGGLDDLTGDDEAARDRRAALADGAFVTRIHVDAHAAEQATLGDVVAAGAGTHVRSLGGLGSFTSVSVRGASPGHTVVVVDGVPLSRVASITADLGKLELDSFDEVELARSGASLGGELALASRVGRTADGAQLWASAGAGSFGARHLRVRWGDGDRAERVATTVEAGYAGADGDFVYFDDGGTNLDPSDDAWRRRGNNGYDHVDVVARAGGPTWIAGVRGLGRSQGLPGATYAPAARATLDTASATADATWTRALDPVALEVGGWALAERQRFADPLGEIGLRMEDRRYLTAAAGASGAARWLRGRHAATLAVEARADGYRDVDALMGDARLTGTRVAAAVTLGDELALAGGRWVIAPSLRLDLLRTDPIADRNAQDVEPPVRTDVAPSPRVSTRALVTPDVALKASAGWYFRAPTLPELYGDRGFLVGSPGLRPERGPSFDAGVVVAPERGRGAVDRVLVEAAAFASFPEDTIALVSTGALVARPVNVGGARIAGVEAVATARLARAVTLAANYTLLLTAQDSPTPSFDGKPLPQRPRHALHARVDAARALAGRLVVVWSDVAWIAGNFLDQAALAEVPARRLVGAGVKVELPGDLTAGLEAKNLLDARIEHVTLDPAPRPDLATVPRAVADVGGYPLPGRALYVTLEWRLR